MFSVTINYNISRWNYYIGREIILLLLLLDYYINHNMYTTQYEAIFRFIHLYNYIITN